MIMGARSVRPRTVLFGYGQFGVVAFEALLRAGCDVRAVVTYRDRAEENCWWQSLTALAQSHAIPVVLDADLAPGSADTRALIDTKPELILSSFYRDLIGDHLLDLPHLGAWNLHPSLLPAYRGRAPLNWQLLHGERRSGLTLHRMVTRADAGGIIAQHAVDVDPDQDAYGLCWQLLWLAPTLLDGALEALMSGTAVERAQDLTRGSVFPRRRPADGRIDWQQSARRIHDLVRAVAPPWPGAVTGHAGHPVIIARSRIVSEHGRIAAPGTVLPGNQIACGDGVLGVVTAITADGVCGPFTPGVTLAHARAESAEKSS